MRSAPSNSLIDLFHHPEAGSEVVDFPADSIVEPTGGYVYLIERGQIRLNQIGPDGRPRLVEIFGPSDWFFASALGGHGEQLVDAVAAVDSRLVRAPGDRLMELLHHHPDASVILIKQLVVKLRSARRDAAALVFNDCNRRLIDTLIRFAATAAASPHEQGVVLRITHQQLAQAVGVARETISLALTHLRRKQMLRTGRNQLIFDPAVLRGLIEPPARAADKRACA